MTSTSMRNWSPGTTGRRKLGSLNASENHQHSRRGSDLGQQQRAPGLRDRFDDQHAGHDRMSGKCP